MVGMSFRLFLALIAYFLRFIVIQVMGSIVIFHASFLRPAKHFADFL